MSLRLFVLFPFALFAGALVLGGCNDGGDDSATSTLNVPAAVQTYCENYCSGLTCTTGRTDGCVYNCEFWLTGFSGACADSIKATFECQGTLSCDDLNAMLHTTGREDVTCGSKLATQVDTCARETQTGCKAYCDLANQCRPESDPTCFDSCRMNHAWLGAMHGDDCFDKTNALYLCEGKTTCDALEALIDKGTVPADCVDERAAYDNACGS